MRMARSCTPCACSCDSFTRTNDPPVFTRTNDPPVSSPVLFAVAGAQNSPPISDPTVGQAFLAISFNTASNNITYQLFADNITEVMAAHIHISSTVGANGSVSIPLYQAPFVGLPGSTSTGLLAASALMPAVFVGPYLEILPDYTNVNVSAVLTQYVQTGLAYAQVCCRTLCLKSHQAASMYCCQQLSVSHVYLLTLVGDSCSSHPNAFVV